MSELAALPSPTPSPTPSPSPTEGPRSGVFPNVWVVSVRGVHAPAKWTTHGVSQDAPSGDNHPTLQPISNSLYFRRTNACNSWNLLSFPLSHLNTLFCFQHVICEQLRMNSGDYPPLSLPPSPSDSSNFWRPRSLVLINKMIMIIPNAFYGNVE